MARSTLFTLFLAFVTISSAIKLAAQVGTGTISGVVTDSSGAVLPGTSVDITNTQTGTSLDPRIGVAWDPFKDHKTSIRAGAGIFHDSIQVRNYHPAYIFSAPYQTAVSLCVFGG